MVEGKVKGVFDGLVHIMYVGACSRARCVENVLIYPHVLAFVPRRTACVRC